MSFHDLPPMDRLAAALADAENGLREAMHAIHDVAADTAAPGDWYDRLGQLETLTRRLGDLIDETSIRVGRLPTGDLYASAGSDVASTVMVVSHSLLDAARLIYEANHSVNTAWSHIGTVGVLNVEGGTS